MPTHTCCAWCEPPLHVVTGLVPARVTTRAQFLDYYGAVLADLAGITILAARPAPEADHAAVVADLQARGAQAYHHTGQRRTPRYTGNDRVWLITYREEEPPCRLNP